jgi:ubiquinone/menaquinone biosynthesis C-methylase UbiE
MKARVIETNEGIQGEFDVRLYDKMQRNLRDKGWIETNDVIASGIDSGHALEIGPGPGYLGLEWLSKTTRTRLTAVEISAKMIEIASGNAHLYGLGDRVEYVAGNALALPFDEASFDAVFTNGSLHEWERPEVVFGEIDRVLKPGGRYFISDLRRDIGPFVHWFLTIAKEKAMRPGLRSSLGASYTVGELETLVEGSPLAGATVSKNFVGVTVRGRKKA